MFAEEFKIADKNKKINSVNIVLNCETFLKQLFSNEEKLDYINAVINCEMFQKQIIDKKCIPPEVMSDTEEMIKKKSLAPEKEDKTNCDAQLNCRFR